MSLFPVMSAKSLMGPVATLAATGLWLAVSPAQARVTVDFKFEPPAIEAQAICARRAPDAELVARWSAWDRKSLEGLDPAVVQREMRRLRELDSTRWYDTLDAAIRLLPAISAGFTPDKVKLEQIELMISAGKLAELQRLGLVEELAKDTGTLSPRVKLALSRYLRLGQGIKADEARGTSLLVEAALGGNADALLEIVALQLDGKAIPGWDVSPELAVAMAFGALVGQLDPQICDRVTRIAREYKNGDVVTRDQQLSERWYRFAAGLGDTDAAWKVAEIHLRSEDIPKDNSVLVSYLERAAASGNPFMALAYGRLYEVGALVPKDLPRAAEIYAAAAATGDRAALMRQVQFLTTLLRDTSAAAPASRAQIEAQLNRALAALVAREDAPSWALVAMADKLVEAKGRWAAQEEAAVYLERAAALGDGFARLKLVETRISPAMDPADFYHELDQLIGIVRGDGMVDPMADLQDILTCRAPGAPRIEEAAYWQSVEQATGSVTVSYSYSDLEALAADPDPLAVAKLQSQALYGRPAAVAQYQIFLELSNAPAEKRAFWDAYGERFAKVASSKGRIYIETQRPDLIARGFATLTAAVAKGDRDAEVQYARALLTVKKPVTKEDRATALSYLEPIAAKGNGTALALLPLADSVRWPDAAAVVADYREAIEAAGDFDALVLALPYVPDRYETYLVRATQVTSCTFEQATELLDAISRTSDRDSFHRWSTIVEALAAQDPWRMTALADRLYASTDVADQERAFTLYEAAWDQRFITAGLRLLAHASDEKGRRYDAALAARLYADLVELSDPGDLVTLLARLRKEDPAVVALTEDRIDPGPLYLRAAEKGEPVAMREYGLILLAKASSADQAAVAADWLARASDAGDGRAMVEYAQLLSLGIGVPASRDMALVWLDRAADLGVEDAEILTRSLNLTKVETQ